MKNIIQRMLTKQSPKHTEHTEDTLIAERSESKLKNDNYILAAPKYKVGYCQSIGMQRDHNEDTLFVLTSLLMGQEENRAFGLYIIADGMGGHLHGEVASKLAVTSMANQLSQRLLTPALSSAPLSLTDSIPAILKEGVMAGHKAILKQAPGGGTTLTATLMFGNYMTIVHVGDSRVYLFNQEEELKKLTRDHSLVNRLLELGQITDEEAATHPQRNILYRALGQGEPFEPDLLTLPIPSKGTLLVCSDGLWGVIPESEIVNIILSNPDPQIACEELVSAANQAGGPDNISSILVYFTK